MAEWVLLVLTMIGSTLLLLIVARYVIVITGVIEHFGSGKDCDLAKIGWGVRAIDKETSVLPTGIRELNTQLVSIRDGLVSIDRSIVAAVQAQE